MAYKVIKRAHSANIAADKDRFAAATQPLTVAYCTLRAAGAGTEFGGEQGERERAATSVVHVCSVMLRKFICLKSLRKLAIMNANCDLINWAPAPYTSPPQDSAGRVHCL